MRRIEGGKRSQPDALSGMWPCIEAEGIWRSRFQDNACAAVKHPCPGRSGWTL